MIFNTESGGCSATTGSERSSLGRSILWLTTGSFFRTLRHSPHSAREKIARTMKRGPGENRDYRAEKETEAEELPTGGVHTATSPRDVTNLPRKMWYPTP